MAASACPAAVAFAIVLPVLLSPPAPASDSPGMLTRREAGRRIDAGP